MRAIRGLLSAILIALLLGCVSSVTSQASKLPYAAWSLGFVAPNYMEVWVEAVEAEDVHGHVFAKLETGTASIGYSGDAAGWSEHVGFGKSRQVTGADLPKRVFVRWQSLVEPETYRAFLDIDDRTRQLMLMSDPPPVGTNFPAGHRFYRKYLVLGLAPGGWLKGWVTSASGEPVPVFCVRGEIEPKGPYDGLSDGKYRPLSERAASYVTTHAISYDSWKCGERDGEAR